MYCGKLVFNFDVVSPKVQILNCNLRFFILPGYDKDLMPLKYDALEYDKYICQIRIDLDKPILSNLRNAAPIFNYSIVTSCSHF